MDFIWALYFWLLYELFSWPLRLALLPTRTPPDVRRFLSRVAGPVSIALVVWWLAHGIVPLNGAAAWVYWFVFLVVAYFYARYRLGPAFSSRTAALALLPLQRRSQWRRDLVPELLSLAVFLGFVAFRRLAPEMTFEIGASGAEKFPNAMFFWSVWHADFLPPEDYWLAGNPQVYYTFGHYFWAWIGRAGAFPDEIVITLGLARAVALTFDASFLLVRSFGARTVSASLGAFAITAGCNPAAWVTLWRQYASARDWAAQRAQAGGEPFSWAEWDWAGYSFWEPSRAIANTVTEFPAWSAILGDFHAHHVALPWLIGWLAVLARGDRWFSFRAVQIKSPKGIDANFCATPALISLIAAGIACVLANLWWAPLIVLGSLAALLWRRESFATPVRAWSLRTAAFALLCVLLALSLVLDRGGLATPLDAAGPGEEAGGIPLRLLPPYIRSTFTELASLWGFQVGLIVVGAIAASILALRRTLHTTHLIRFSLLALGAFIALVAIAVNISRGDDPGEPALYWLALIPLVAAFAVPPRAWLAPRPALFTAGACLLLGGLEFFYVQDRMTGDLARYNSYFKFSYPAWPVLGAAAWIAAHRLWFWPGRSALSRESRWALRPVLLLVALALCGMIAFGMPARILQARIGDAAPREPTLNAFTWLANRPGYEAEAEALAWIRENIPPRERVITAPVEGGYNFGGRVASLGGHPVFLGWDHHEFQWRGEGAAAPVSAAREKLQRFWSSRTRFDLYRAANSLDARWVVLGKNELARLGPTEFTRFESLLDQTATLRAEFGSGPDRVRIYELPDSPPPLPEMPRGDPAANLPR